MTFVSLNWKQLTCLKAGGAICLPVIMAGQALCSHYGLTSALAAILAGNGILLAMAAVMAVMSFESRLTTTDNAQLYFGAHGTRCFALTLLIAKCSWFAIQLDLMALSLQALAPEWLPVTALRIGIGILIISVAMHGIRALSVLSAWSLPVLLVTMGYALFIAGREDRVPMAPMQFSFDGISVAIATAITAVIDMPTYFRHAVSKAQGVAAAVILFALALPAIESLGVYLCYKNPGGNVLDTLRHDSTPLWNLWVSLFLLLAGWSTNNTNLYSAVTCLGTLFPASSEKRRTVLLGCIGTAVSLVHILNYFTGVLQCLGIMVGSMGSVILAAYLLKKAGVDGGTPKVSQKINLSLWGLGILCGFSSMTGVFRLTGIPLLDAFACAGTAAVVYYFTSGILNVIRQRKEIYESIE